MGACCNITAGFTDACNEVAQSRYAKEARYMFEVFMDPLVLHEARHMFEVSDGFASHMYHRGRRYSFIGQIFGRS
jgi:hypothetical protein